MTQERDRKKEPSDKGRTTMRPVAPTASRATKASQTAPAAQPLLALPTTSEQHENILALQRTVGNQAVMRLLAQSHSPEVTPQASNVIARAPKGNKKGGTPAASTKTTPAKKSTLAVKDRPGALAVDAAYEALRQLKEAATRAEDREATAAEATIAKDEAVRFQTEVARQIAIFDAAVLADTDLSGWKQKAGQATIQADSAVERATASVEKKTTTEAQLGIATEAAKVAATLQSQMHTSLKSVQGRLTEIKTSEKQIYAAPTLAEASLAAGTTATVGTKLEGMKTKYDETIVKIEAAYKQSSGAYKTATDNVPGTPLATSVGGKNDVVYRSLELARDTMAVINLIMTHGRAAVARAERVLKAKQLAEEKAKVAQDAKLDADKKATAIQEAERAAEDLAKLSSEAATEAERLEQIKRDADALFQSAEEDYAKAEAKAEQYRAIAADPEALDFDLSDGLELAVDLRQEFNTEADTFISDAERKRTDAKAKADEATAPRDEAATKATDAKKEADDAKAKAEDPAMLKAASDAKNEATATGLAATTASSDRDATEAIAKNEATSDAASFEQQARLSGLAGTQRRVDELSNSVPDPDKLEALLRYAGSYDVLKEMLAKTGSQTNLEALVPLFTASNKLKLFLNTLGFERLNRYLALPLTVTQIDDLITRVSDAATLDTLMTNYGYARLDMLLKMPSATADKLEKLWTVVGNRGKIITLTDAIVFKTLYEYIDKGVAVATIEDFVTKLPDATQRETVMKACAGDKTLLADLLTKTTNGGAKLAAWLGPDGGQKATELNGFLDDGTRKGDYSMIWDATQTIATSAVPITSPNGQTNDMAFIIANAVPATPSSTPPINGYAGNRPWGVVVGPGDAVLPQYTAGGAKITYTEYDIHPYTSPARGLDRVVVGSDGRKYFTNDHYKHYKLMS